MKIQHWSVALPGLVVLGVACLAALLPVIRALRIDPAEILRAE